MNRWEGHVVTTTERLTLRTFREDVLPQYPALNPYPAGAGPQCVTAPAALVAAE